MNMNTTTSPNDVLTLKNPSFCAYLICSCLLVLKMIFVALYTAYQRKIHKAFLAPEDANFNKGEITQHDAVERVRRAHLNDLENIPIFWTSAFAYLFTRPSVVLTFILFFGFTIARYCHTVVYAIFILPQPTRAILFFTGLIITLYMAVHSIIVGFVNLC